MKVPAPVSLAMLSIMAVVSAGYLAVAVLDIDPRTEYSTVTVLLGSSGGLMDTSPVTLRGVRIGEVTEISSTPDGLAAELRIDTGRPVPAASEVEIANLSAVGEQYLDFRPTTTGGPYLSDGAVIPADRVHTPATVGQALTRVDALLDQLDPETIDRLLQTVAIGYKDRDTDVATVNRAFELLGHTLADKKDALRRLYLNGQTLTGNFEGYGPQLAAVAPEIAGATPDMVLVNKGFEDYSRIGDGVWDDPYAIMNERTDRYLDLLAPDLAQIAATLEPTTAPIRPLRVDAGSLMHLLETVFPGGPARVTVELPPK
ncbi:MlaD family protein [Nocardia wallacei]|uniref:MlaD family protein n=1 Tax=Nocardia wallacei TaxID=480035 RepID=UPI00245430DF|nr:MlaD family protein [Nocardia wallacei]